jgi:hypothetical protein
MKTTNKIKVKILNQKKKIFWALQAYPTENKDRPKVQSNG